MPGRCCSPQVLFRAQCFTCCAPQLIFAAIRLIILHFEPVFLRFVLQYSVDVLPWLAAQRSIFSTARPIQRCSARKTSARTGSLPFWHLSSVCCASSCCSKPAAGFVVLRLSVGNPCVRQNLFDFIDIFGRHATLDHLTHPANCLVGPSSERSLFLVSYSFRNTFLPYLKILHILVFQNRPLLSFRCP